MECSWLRACAEHGCEVLVTDYKDLFKVLVDSDSFKLLIVFLMLCSGFLIFSMVGIMKSILTAFLKKMNGLASELSSVATTTQTKIEDYQTYLDSVTKVFTSRLDKVKDEVFGELRKLEANAGRLEEQVRAYSAAIGDNTAKTQERLVLVQEIKAEVEKTSGKIKTLEDTRATVDDLSRLYEIIKSHNAEIRELKRK